jgi:Ferritin-like domain
MAPFLTRREALGGAAAALVLGSCGGGDPPPGGGPRPGSGAALYSSLLALQHAAVAAYGACEEVLHGNALTQVRAIREQERQIGTRLATLITDLGGEPPAGKSAEEYARTFPRLRSEQDALHFADDLEQRQLRAYLDALNDLPREGQRVNTVGGASLHAQHLAAVRLLQGLPAAEGPFVTGSL